MSQLIVTLAASCFIAEPVVKIFSVADLTALLAVFPLYSISRFINRTIVNRSQSVFSYYYTSLVLFIVHSCSYFVPNETQF